MGGRHEWERGDQGDLERSLNKDISVPSIYAVVKFSPAPGICWILKEGREMADMILGWSFAAHLWQKAKDLRKYVRLLK